MKNNVTKALNSQTRIMRTSLLITLVAIALAFVSCKKSDDDTPDCIKDKITELENKPVQNPAAVVVKWEVDGQTYYYITSDCCDQYNFLYDTDCNVVCAPDGGFTGQGDGNCPNFSTTPKETIIWQDNR